MLFGPGLAAAGVRVTARIDALRLALSLPDGTPLSTGLSELSLRKAGFNDAQWELSWTLEHQAWALLIDDPQSMAALLAAPPAGLAKAIADLQRRHRRRRTGHGLAWSAIAVWLALPLLLILALVLAARPLAGAIAGLIPASSEQRLGDWAFQAQSARLQLITDTAANAALEQIGKRLVGESVHTYRWYLTRDASLNAFAMPGGIVVVHSGLIEAADNAEELAGVLAHEIEHVELRHSLKAMMQQAGLRLSIAALIGDIGMAGDAATRLSGLGFSRDSEREADRQGLERLIRAGIDPRGMPALFTRLGAQNGLEAPAWMSSHPATPERIEALKTVIDARKLPPARPLDLDWNAVRASIAE